MNELEGTKCPLFYCMDYQKLENIVEQVLEEENAFLVQLKLKEGNNITLNADSFEGMTFQRLKMINRKIEALLDRDVEDFNLTVSSPGLDRPFLVKKQYELNINRTVKVNLKSQDIVVGKLVEVNDEQIVIQTKQSKKEQSKTLEIAFADILETKVEIEF
ncbi:MAG: hypothetical protein N4A46_06410 [Schleiferiaceae bacterium]|nr:hypothetical protein [Schleiferiaceae bacterium]